MTRHVRFVADLLILQGALELIPGTVISFLTLRVVLKLGESRILTGAFPPGFEAMVRSSVPVFLVLLLGPCLLAVGMLKIVAGFKNLRMEGRSLGLWALASSVVAVPTCYCAPTAVAVAVYGLIVYLNDDVRDAFLAGPERIVINSTVSPQKTAAAAAASRRLEISGVGPAGSQVAAAGRSIASRTSFTVGKQERPLRLLRFAAFRCQFSAAGLEASYESGMKQQLSWNDIAMIAVRQLPGEAPWDNALVLDLLPNGDKATPIRLITGESFIAFPPLPGPASMSNVDKVRGLCRFAREQNVGIAFEELTAPFCEGGPCPRLAGMGLFSKYDERYG